MILLIFFCGYLGMYTYLAASSELIVIQYSAENAATNDARIFRATLIMETERKIFIEMMRDAARIDNRFQFVTEEHNEYGHYVIAINGVYESVDDRLYWAFMKEENGEKCHMQSGISTYIPAEGEHMLFELVPWDFVAPQC